MDEATKRQIARTRDHFAWFGHPLDAMSDEEIVAGVLQSARAIASCGVSVNEAAHSLAEAFAAFAKPGDLPRA